VAGHVPGARNHPFGASLDAGGRFLPPAVLSEALVASLDGVPAERTIVYCGSGVTACHALLALEHAGLRGARLYPGSWSEWTRDPARPVATGAAP
jgi:thiosulfate/3-mercaptopyruvate sulfurtransferase